MFRISILHSVKADHGEILFIFYCIASIELQSEFVNIFKHSKCNVLKPLKVSSIFIFFVSQ